MRTFKEYLREGPTQQDDIDDYVNDPTKWSRRDQLGHRAPESGESGTEDEFDIPITPKPIKPKRNGGFTYQNDGWDWWRAMIHSYMYESHNPLSYIPETINEQSYNLAMRPSEDDPDWFGDVFGNLPDEVQRLLYDQLIGTHVEEEEEEEEEEEDIDVDKIDPIQFAADIAAIVALQQELQNAREIQPEPELDTGGGTISTSGYGKGGPLRLIMNSDGSVTLTNQEVKPDEVLAPSDWGRPKPTVSENNRRAEIKQILKQDLSE